MNRQVDRRIVEQMEGCMAGKVEEWMDGQMVNEVGRETVLLSC
jgi:hypothetical protein